jgi:phosphoribosyl-ATP pyrophosphohydrolase/phosphoribosyl-AMP cyclohydrolase
MTSLSQLDWDKNGGLLPAVIQDVNSGAVLMLGYMRRSPPLRRQVG